MSIAGIPSWKRDAALLLLTLLAGLLLGLGVGRRAAARSDRSELGRFADMRLHDFVGVAADADGVVQTVQHDNLPFCSDEDLAFMRHIVFMSADVRDIGRLHGHRLFCASGVGRLATPLEPVVPDYDDGDVRIFAAQTLLISPQTHGFVIERNGVSVVLNPDAYRELDEPPMIFGVWVAQAAEQKLVFAVGHRMPLNYTQVTSGAFFRENGILYRSVCAPAIKSCLVASVSAVAFAARAHSLLVAYTAMGAFLGALVGLILVLYLHGRYSMERQLRRALRKHIIRLDYQPIYDLHSGKLVAAEALARWPRKGGGTWAPDVFIPVAEQRSFIGEFTRYVVQQAVTDLGSVMAAGQLRVTVNITADDLADETFPEFLEQTLAAAGVPASALGIELTERSTANPVMATAAIERLRRNGHAIYIDDFGTGYSSLAYLHQLSVDAIKIDRSFTQTLGTEVVTSSVVPQILSMAATLDLSIVVEGVETREQADYFAAWEHNIFGQGWYFGKPMPPAQILELVTRKQQAPFSSGSLGGRGSHEVTGGWPG